MFSMHENQTVNIAISRRLDSEPVQQSKHGMTLDIDTTHHGLDMNAQTVRDDQPSFYWLSQRLPSQTREVIVFIFLENDGNIIFIK